MRFALALPLLLVAAPAVAQEPYRAVGTEPFWSLTIEGARIRYQPAQGRPLTVVKPRPIIGINGELYRTRQMTVSITHVRCSDGMSDRSYRDTVKLTIGRRTLSGCGGETIEGESRLAGNWTITAMDGRAVRMDRPATVRFTGERIEGRICNSFGGTYRLDGATLTTTKLISTKMACPSEPMRVEARFFEIVDSSSRVSWQGRDRLVLSGRAGSVTLRRER